MNGNGDNEVHSVLSQGTKIGYGMGDFAFNLAYQTIIFYLMYYFTDVFVIGAAAAGTIFLVSKLWDAVSDPLMGIISDHTKLKMGSKRPYLLIGALPLGISLFLLFASPDLPEGMRIQYGYLTFILFCTAITVVSIPYGALTPAMTLDMHERSVLTGYRMAFAIIGTLVAAGATKALVGIFPNETAGFRGVSLAYGLIIALVTIITFASTKEKIHTQEKHLSLAQQFRLVFSNRPFVILAIATILFMIAVNMMGIVVSYYFKYNLKNEAMIPVAFIALLVTATVFLPLFVHLNKRLDKRRSYIVGMSILAAALVLLYLIKGAGIPVTIAIFVLGGIGMAANWLSPWAMIPDTVEYSEWKMGARREGILIGSFFFCFKFGSAISGFLVGLGLNLVGYVPNVEQSAASLQGIHMLLTIVPLLFLVAGIVTIWFYPINEEYYKMMLSKIQGRKNQSTAT